MKTHFGLTSSHLKDLEMNLLIKQIEVSRSTAEKANISLTELWLHLQKGI